MKSKLFSSFIALLAAALLSGPGLLAKDAAAPATPPKRPTLRIDPSPVSDGKSAVVTSYADIVEPVQRAVVSVYSKKTVRERVSANPLMRQFFGDVPDQERERKEERVRLGELEGAPSLHPSSERLGGIGSSQDSSAARLKSWVLGTLANTVVLPEAERP